MQELIVSPTWTATYPGASIGILAMRDVANPTAHAGLEAEKAALEAELRARYAGYDRPALRALPVLQAYADYYRPFRKTYHVQLQLESAALKGKSIPSVAALVETMFMAELKNQLLTAGHDLEAVQRPVRVDVADGSETYLRLNGQEQQLKAGDMYIADAQGILSSILYGPDRRTQIRPETTQALFTVYAPAGIERETVRQHLQDIQSYVLLVTPEAETTVLNVYGTN
jgi:DNA/RNA-binding domain of Phe-tRNA-synthetase-like protein